MTPIVELAAFIYVARSAVELIAYFVAGLITLWKAVGETK